MKVRTLLARKENSIITAPPTLTVQAALDILMDNKISCLPIVVNDAVMGIVSDKDILKCIHNRGEEYKSLTLEDVMTTEILIGKPDDELHYIASVMKQNEIRHVPIFEDGKMVGLVSLTDVLRTAASNAQIENRYLRLYTEGMGMRDKSADF
jgi:CBS domain-containing protein